MQELFDETLMQELFDETRLNGLLRLPLETKKRLIRKGEKAMLVFMTKIEVLTTLLWVMIIFGPLWARIVSGVIFVMVSTYRVVERMMAQSIIESLILGLYPPFMTSTLESIQARQNVMPDPENGEPPASNLP